MMLLLLVTASLALSASARPPSSLPFMASSQGVNLKRLEDLAAVPDALRIQNGYDAYRPSPSAEFVEHYFTQPLDHFAESPHTFGQRYWINTRHYLPGTGGPVIVLDGGETSGENRIPFLDTGIVDILARATRGVGVVLEHRYYGKSIPVANFSTDSLRWLNNNQSAADSANFMANVKFPGVDEDLTAPNTPWIYYGGSYAGARAAHMRVLYPELVYGAIASSGVTHATFENWEYMEVIRKAAHPKCSAHLENSIKTIDNLLSANRVTNKAIKMLFGLSDLKHDEDFASLIESPLGSWQAKNWDPAVGSTRFDEFCAALSKPPMQPGLPSIDDLPFGHPRRIVRIGGHERTGLRNDGLAVDVSVVNYAQWIKQNYVANCPDGWSMEDCFGTFDDAKFQDTSLSSDWRLWIFQVCTEWGYFATAPPDQNHPRIVSSLLTLEYQSRICHQAFPPGNYFAVPPLPDVESVNSLGDFSIAADRLAIIDGEVDPWRPATPHSEYADDREDTMLRPFKLIPGGVHHYDEFGLRDLDREPFEIRKIHGEMIVFVMEWLKDWMAPVDTTKS